MDGGGSGGGGLWELQHLNFEKLKEKRIETMQRQGKKKRKERKRYITLIFVSFLCVYTLIM